MTDRNKIGRAGEYLAAEMLKGRGYNIISRNYICPCGEIDIIAQKNGVISFVEVKTRTSLCWGEPAEAVGQNKRRHIRNSARYFLDKNDIDYEFADFHVVEITVNHIQGLGL